MQTAIRLQSLPFGSTKTYLVAAIFIAGNIIMPQMCHLLPQGGTTWLPIYFFTLVGAYIYGWRVGLLTACASPVINALLFGMPAVGALPAIIIKSTILSLSAGYAAARFKKASLGILTMTVACYQILGTMGEWIIKGDLWTACQDFRIGIPGMLVQIIGGWFIINLLTRK